MNQNTPYSMRVPANPIFCVKCRGRMLPALPSGDSQACYCLKCNTATLIGTKLFQPVVTRSGEHSFIAAVLFGGAKR